MGKRRGRRDPFEGFQDVEAIGQGAFAQVHRAIDTCTGQPVALKILTIETSKRLDAATFDLLARALGTVNDHPNIVTLYRAVARPNQAPMLVMELCQGSLADELERNGPLSVQQVIAIGVKMCGALQTAHDAGILHRDLKPQNLLITRYGEPALADLGVAALRDAATGSGSPPSRLTLLHAAPEVILGRHANPASDVYGLVSTLYELLGGHAPHVITADEDPAVVQRRVLNDPPPALQAPDVTRRLSDLVTQALAKAPDDRPPTARDLAQRLRLVEVESGWPPTPCRIAGEVDLPVPYAPPPTPSSSRAARMTGLPDLGLGTRPLGTEGSQDRGLEPLGPRETVLLPSRGTRTASGIPRQPHRDVASSAQPTVAADLDTSSRDACRPPEGEDAAAPANDDPKLTRRPSGVLPGFDGTVQARGADDPGARLPPTPAPEPPAPSRPSQEAHPAREGSTDPTAPLWGYEERRGLHEASGLASSRRTSATDHVPTERGRKRGRWAKGRRRG